MTPDEHLRAARALAEAEAKATQIPAISGAFPDITMDDAYEIQRHLVDLKSEHGRQVRGRKIGLTSRAMQQQLGIDIPDSGVLFDDMFFESGDLIPKGRFIEPRVEAEIAFVMAKDLKAAAATAQDVLDATEYVTPALEILDTRIYRVDPETGQPRRIFDTIADNAANAGIVLGDAKHNPKEVDLRWIGAILSRNGQVEETGLGAGVLNDPLESMAWLVIRLAKYDDYLRAGDVVLSGSFIRAVEAPSGSKFTADFGEFGQLDISFE